MRDLTEQMVVMVRRNELDLLLDQLVAEGYRH